MFLNFKFLNLKFYQLFFFFHSPQCSYHFHHSHSSLPSLPIFKSTISFMFLSGGELPAFQIILTLFLHSLLFSPHWETLLMLNTVSIVH